MSYNNINNTNNSNNNTSSSNNNNAYIDVCQDSVLWVVRLLVAITQDDVHHRCEVQFVCANACCDCQVGSFANVLMTFYTLRLERG